MRDIKLLYKSNSCTKKISSFWDFAEFEPQTDGLHVYACTNQQQFVSQCVKKVWVQIAVGTLGVYGTLSLIMDQ